MEKRPACTRVTDWKTVSPSVAAQSAAPPPPPSLPPTAASLPAGESLPSSEGGDLKKLPLTRELSAAKPLTEGEKTYRRSSSSSAERSEKSGRYTAAPARIISV